MVAASESRDELLSIQRAVEDFYVVVQDDDTLSKAAKALVLQHIDNIHDELASAQWEIAHSEPD